MDNKKQPFEKRLFFCAPYDAQYILWDLFYARAAVMIAMEYTSIALHPRDKSLIGAFKPKRIGPYASKLPIRCAIL